VVFFETEMQDRMQARAALESGLHHALEHEEFRLLFQPIVGCEKGSPHGVEALIRWPTAPGDEPLSPSVFMPLAEESDLITGVGSWVLRTACRDFADWKAGGAGVDYVSVNVSARQLRDPGIVGLVRSSLAANYMRPGDLHLEITEGVLADGPLIARVLDELARLGVHLALDDFGTGYSSLSYLRRYPIHSVKIDQSFITETPTSTAACRLVESIIAMATALGKHVVAEGVETEAQLRFLETAGCGSIQGFLYGRPMDTARIPAHFRRIRTARHAKSASRTQRRSAAR
jgi:EAL domain-containing protein (putative c-di-GMP-specific phosphodiesterase class I)